MSHRRRRRRGQIWEHPTIPGRCRRRAAAEALLVERQAGIVVREAVPVSVFHDLRVAEVQPQPLRVGEGAIPESHTVPMLAVAAIACPVHLVGATAVAWRVM